MRKWVRRLIVIICVTCPLSLCALLYAPMLLYRLATDAIAPPNYPGSQRVESNEYIGSAIYSSEELIYHTSDPLEKALAFMEQHMPGFKPQYIAEYDRWQYWNSVKNTSGFARELVSFIGPERWDCHANLSATGNCTFDVEDYLPSVYVRIYTDDSTGTFISVNLSRYEP